VEPLVIFGLLIVLAFFAALVFPGRLGWLIVAGVVPAAVWWYLAYRDNAGADHPSGAETAAVTGFFALAYWCGWMVAVAVGAGARRLLSPRSRRQIRT
jgi:hypothetical protein